MSDKASYLLVYSRDGFSVQAYNICN